MLNRVQCFKFITIANKESDRKAEGTMLQGRDLSSGKKEEVSERFINLRR